MAKKKVNIKFLIILTVVIGGLSLLAFAGVIYSRHTSAYYLKRSAEAEAQGDLPRAAQYLSIAANKDLTNTALFIRSGEMFERLVKIDPAYMGNANRQYRRALELDPTYQPAIDRLLGQLIDELHDGAAGPDFFGQLKHMSDQAIVSDRNNPSYQIYSHVASLQQWMYGTARANAAIDKEIAEFSKLAEQNPQVADGAFYVSMAQLRTARDFLNSGQVDQYHQTIDAIVARHQAMTAARPQDPAVQWRAGLVYIQLREADDRADRRAKYDELVTKSLAAARSSVKPTDTTYDDVQHACIFWMRGQRSPVDQIEKVYREWAAARPYDARVRLEMAEFLGSSGGKRAEAMDLLSKPVEPDPQAKGYEILRTRGLQRATLVLLNTFRAQDAAVAQGKDRAPILAAIDADLPRIAALGSGEDAQYLKLCGKAQMLHGNPVEAIKSFERANTATGTQIDLDLWTQLQNAYLVTGQTGTAQQMMENLLARLPGYTDLRVKLAALYLGTGQNDKAAQQIKIAEANPSKDPTVQKELAQLSVALAVRQSDSPGARKQLSALPEGTAAERLYKARMLSGAKEPAEASRLYQLVLRDDPANLEAVGAMVNQSMQQKNRPQAQKFVSDALKVNPQNAQLLALNKRLSIDTPEALRQYQDEVASQIPDPLSRTLSQATLAMERGDFAAAQNRLGEADKINSQDPQTLLGHIQWFVAQRKFDEAGPWIEKAAAANADRMDGVLIRAEVAVKRGDSAESLKWANELVRKYGEFASNWVLLGQAQQAVGQYRDAISSYDQAIQRQPTDIDAMKGRIVCLEATGDYAEEKTSIDHVRQLAPQDLTLRDLALNWELHHGDPDLVVKTCQDILKNEPDNAAVYAALGQAEVVAAQTKYAADPALTLRLLTDAKDVLRSGMVKFGATPEVLQLYTPMAMTLEALGNPSAAQEVLKQFDARPEMKNKPDAMRELARLYERHGQAREAEAAWRDAYARSPQDLDVELELAQFLVKQNRSDDALKILSGAHSTNPRVENQRIEMLLSTNRLDEAQKLIDQAYGATPSSALAFLYRGLIRLARDQFQPAIDDLSTARDKDSRNPVIQLWLARAMLRAGRTDEATSQLEDALRRNPLRDDARVDLLNAYASGASPRWDDFDRVTKEALGNPALSGNPIWHQRYARSLAQRGQFALAKQEIASAQKLAPNSMQLEDEYVNILVQSKDWATVLSETDRQLAAGYRQPFVYGKRGLAKAGLGDKPAAIAEFDTAISGYQTTNNAAGIADIVRTVGQALGPDEAMSRLALVKDPATNDLLTIELYGLKNDRVDQAKAAEIALSRSTPLSSEQRASILRTAADAYVVLQRWDGARKSLEELVKLRPNDIVSLNDLAYLIASVQNSPQDAKPYAKRAYDLAQNSAMPSIADTYGWILAQCGGRDLPEAVAVLQHLVDSNQDFIIPRYHLAVAYLNQGGWQRAGEELAKVQQQMLAMEQKHQPVPDELKTGVPKALEQVRQKSGQASGAIAQ